MGGKGQTGLRVVQAVGDHAQAIKLKARTCMRAGTCGTVGATGTTPPPSSCSGRWAKVEMKVWARLGGGLGMGTLRVACCARPVPGGGVGWIRAPVV